MPKNSICTKYVFALSMYLIRIAFHHSILRAIHTKNLQARIWIQWIPLFMHGVQFLKKITSSKNVLNSRTPGAHAGGRGCACAPAFFLYYYHPPHNFFRNMPPWMGLRFAHGYYGGMPTTPKLTTPLTPSPPRSCTLRTTWPRYRGYWYVVWDGVFRFYVVTEQVIEITRGEILNPTATIPVKVRCL